ncbi:MAG: hypothetical protein LBQ95_08745 [Lachnospiraceae bacterium]|jgi:hypothetical protein|nr:hypothetical protein [Lachnospiraceae bacterium]
MSNDNKAINRAAIFFIIINAAIYLGFLTIDLYIPKLGFVSSYFKFSGLVFCFLFTFFVRVRSDIKEVRYDASIQISVLLFTMIADVFLLFTGHFLIGIFVFYCAHLMAVKRFRPEVLIIYCVVAVAGIIAAAFFYFVVSAQAGILCASAFYAFLIISVTVFAFKGEEPGRFPIAGFGMICFLICDIFVAIYNSLPVIKPVYDTAAILMWACYLPAQTLLAISTAYRKRA